MSSYISQMEQLISKAKYGSVLGVSEFTDIMDYETAKKAISRLEKSGKIRRVMRGVYDKPEFSQLLNEYAAADPNEIAQALARNYNWTIAPSGETALNILGLSTQVPANWAYISTGPYRSYEIGNVKIEFLHRANKTIERMSRKTALVIEALRAIGKANITEAVVRKIRTKLSKEETDRLVAEARPTTSWIYSVVKQIASN